MLLWALIVLVGVAFSSDSFGFKMATISMMGICALIYYCFTFLILYNSCFSSHNTSAKFCESIDKMLKSHPIIAMNVSCYHDAYSSGMVTHKTSEFFPYLSWRDITGQLKVETSGATFVLLELSVEVQFVNDGTIEDYNKAKQDFLSRNRYDRYQSYCQQNATIDFRREAYIRVTDDAHCFFGREFFIFFGLLTFGALYFSYINCYIRKQKFAIKKAVSTRQNLNAPEIQTQYAYYDPRVVMFNQMTVFKGAQGPQIYELNHLEAQNYMNMQMAQPEIQFISIVQGEEVTEVPGGEYRPVPAYHQTHLGINPIDPQYGVQQVPSQQIITDRQIVPQSRVIEIK